MYPKKFGLDISASFAHKLLVANKSKHCFQMQHVAIFSRLI